MVKDVFTLIGYTGISQLIAFLGSVLLTRIYSPEQFGLVAFFLAIGMILSTISYGKYDLAIILPKRKQTAIDILKISIFLSFVSSLVIFVFILFVNELYGEIEYIYFMLPILVFFIGFNSIFDKYNNRQKNYGLMGAQRVIKSGFDFIICYASMVFFDQEYGLLMGLLSGFAISSFLMMYFGRLDFKNKKNINFARSIKVLFFYRKFPFYTMPHTLLNTLSGNSLILLIPFLYDNHILGLYAFGLKLVQAPMSLVSNSLYSVFNKEMVIIKNKNESLKKFYRENIIKLLMLASPLMICLFFSGELFALFMGDEWRESGEYVEIMLPMLLLVFIASPFASIPHLFQCQDKALLIEIISTLLKILALFIGSIYLDFTVVLSVYTYISCVIIIYMLFWYFQIIKCKG